MPAQPTPSATPSAGRTRGFWGVAALLFGVGLVSRVAPLADQGGRLLQQFPTEDGYLMLTIARNLGTGKGMSIADGTLPTNGTQPLTTGLWSLVFAAFDGDRAAGVAGVLVLEVLIAVAATFCLFRLGRRLLRDLPSGEGWAAVAASAWFASALSARHSMNCLESGAYALVVVLFAWALLRFAEGREEGDPAYGRWAGLGALLGLVFWVRVDAVLLCAGLGVVHLAGGLPTWPGPLRQRFVQLACAGTATGLVAAPWLLHNLLRFGSIMPVSGQSEGFRVALGQELPLVPAKLLEYLAVIVQIPNGIETHPAVMLGATAVLALAAFLAARSFAGWSPEARTVGALIAAYAVGLLVYYGLFFGAGHFMSRYLFPLSPFLAVLAVGWAAPRLPARAAPVAALVALVLVGALNARVYRGGDHHEHFQVVSWIEQNVPERVWVGAVQTGTIGFFHDRTINLDGKVNPAAMEARRVHKIPEYVADSGIQYLADWRGITRWMEHHPALQETFHVAVHDPERNLGVLRRNGAPRKQP